MMTFDEALAVVLEHEGGYVNHPRDPGGRTNLGVTQRVWERWLGRPVTKDEMKTLTPGEVSPLYRAWYWKKVHAHELPDGLNLHVFDFGVNAGPRRAIRYLQKMVGTVPDGLFGPMTRRAVRKYIDKHGLAYAINRYGDARERYYRRLRHFPTFGRGWLRRNNAVTYEALQAVRCD